ncbi:MAG: 3-phosphoserine/phosphohydroxythreonine transaminase [Saprospiraceae bacterium]|nr:3-phosphoserine/phosphohydroxythreonine transaminase [Saprospiraceae bacterium]
MKIYNFSPGPSILPKEVFEQAAQGVLNLNGSGLSILEISHRSRDFTEIITKARDLVRELLDVPKNYHILFLSGGASTQFLMSAMNLLPSNGTAAYLDTGSWSSKAIKEAKPYGNVDVIASSKDRNYAYIPKGYKAPSEALYLHLTSNNTISGTQFHEFPEVNIPLVCDMSSDIFSRPVDVKRFGLIYAGAQKNMGPAGTTVVIIHDELVGQSERILPTIMDYQTHIDKDSMFNTPPVFPIYGSMLTMQWIKDNGGIAAAAERNEKKASTLYAEIDRNSLFDGVVDKEDRSKMNVTFVMRDVANEAAFIDAASEAGCMSIKGHRSVGGFRASIYNAMTLEGVEKLVYVMQEFERANG